MPRETSQITARDIKIKALGKQVLKLVKTKKEWFKFRAYMDFYFMDLPSHLDKIKVNKWCKSSGNPCERCKTK